ncbi:MAG: hypothetical protein K0R63_1162 [Rickettsiales bacterium]|jgi:hypothetical protein|nr:hypothetical protein [Rickettsiales bacterium]
MEIFNNSNIPAAPAPKRSVDLPAPVKARAAAVTLPAPVQKSQKASVAIGPVVQRAHAHTYAVSDEVFSIFKTLDGKLRTQIRNLETGEVTMTPPLDGYEFFVAVRGDAINQLAKKME